MENSSDCRYIARFRNYHYTGLYLKVCRDSVYPHTVLVSGKIGRSNKISITLYPLNHHQSYANTLVSRFHAHRHVLRDSN